MGRGVRGGVIHWLELILQFDMGTSVAIIIIVNTLQDSLNNNPLFQNDAKIAMNFLVGCFEAIYFLCLFVFNNNFNQNEEIPLIQ